jgi:hypothetical protein
MDKSQGIPVSRKVEDPKHRFCQENTQELSLAEVFAELRQICSEERYELEISPRKDRPNPFVDDDDFPQ